MQPEGLQETIKTNPKDISHQNQAHIFSKKDDIHPKKKFSYDVLFDFVYIFIKFHS